MTQICVLITDFDLITDCDFITKFLEVSIEHCNGCGKPTEDAYSSDHLILSHFGLAFVLMLRPCSPGLVMFSDFEFRKKKSILLGIQIVRLLPTYTTQLLFMIRCSGLIIFSFCRVPCYKTMVHWLFCCISLESLEFANLYKISVAPDGL